MHVHNKHAYCIHVLYILNISALVTFTEASCSILKRSCAPDKTRLIRFMGFFLVEWNMTHDTKEGPVT